MNMLSPRDLLGIRRADAKNLPVGKPLEGSGLLSNIFCTFSTHFVTEGTKIYQSERLPRVWARYYVCTTLLRVPGYALPVQIGTRMPRWNIRVQAGRLVHHKKSQSRTLLSLPSPVPRKPDQQMGFQGSNGGVRDHDVEVRSHTS